MNCEKLFTYIDSLEQKYLNVLEDVCNIESPTNNKQKVDEVGNYFIEMANQKGWDIDILKHDVAGNAICITMNSNSTEKPICLSGHIDTVFPLGAFGYPPVKSDAENMYGPGVMDCKGGVVGAFMAMDALKSIGYSARPIKLIIQTDEETGSSTSGKATINYMCEKAKNSVAFFNLEGHLKNTAVLVRKGILRYKLEVFGKALHSSRCFDGANAITEASYKIIQLEKMKDADGLTCNCGVISGGSTANSVAENCTFYADIRFADLEQLALAREKVKEIAEKVFVEGCSCKFSEISFRPAMPSLDKNKALLEKMNSVYKKSGLPILKGRSCLSGADVAYITEIGVPCVDCLGTEGYNIHSINEYIRLSSLAESAKRLASVIYLFDEIDN